MTQEKKAGAGTAQDRQAENDVPAAPKRELSPAAQRALAEAAERRRAREVAEAAAGPAAKEINGRSGPDPVRYGDWELKGIISDF
jgi:hypothetical protein